MISRVFVPFVISAAAAAACGAETAPVADGPPRPRVFAVSPVAKAQEALPARPANSALRQADGDEFEAAPELPGQQWVFIEKGIRHPFLAAAHLAFAEHRPLALSPDLIWLLLGQLAASEVLAKPESYRQLFTPHASGKRTLSVVRNDFVASSQANDWPGVLAEFEAQIIGQAPDPVAGSFAHPFGTSTPCELAARRATLLKTASPFYQYHLATMCGIPEIVLHGSTDDWRWIRQHAEDFRRLGMTRRIDALLPVLDQFVAAAGGQPDPAFWRSFYKFDSESGSSYVSGWINLFFLGEDDKALDQVLAKSFRWSEAPLHEERDGAVNLPLAQRTAAYVSDGATDVEFVWRYFEESRPMRLRAGFLGISQDPQTLALRPQIAWQVLRRKTSEQERAAFAYLGSLRELGWSAVRAIRMDFVFDPKSGGISIQRRSRSDTIGAKFWERALPLMGNLESVDLAELLPSLDEAEGNEASLAVCKALLSVPGLQRILMPHDLDASCRQLLEERKDWSLEMREE